MAGSRTLKLSILADIDDLKKNLGKGEKEVQGFGGQLEKFSKVAAAAFAAAAAAAAAYAGKLAIEGVKAAIADEAAQKRLALALKNVTEATDEQIKTVEEQIRQTSLATGIADDKLRPALQRLATATGSVERSQELLNLALDISAATGKDVETVTAALAKAYDGNNSSLTRLGVGLSAAEVKTLGFEGTVKQLSDTFGGAAATQANTFEGQIKRLQVAFDEAKESVGAALLPTLQNLLNFFVNTIIPKFTEFKDKALEPITKAINNNKDAFQTLYNFIRNFVIPIVVDGLGDALGFIGKVVGVTLTVIGKVVDAVKGAIQIGIDGINALIGVYNNTLGKLPGVPDIPKISTPSFGGGSSSTPKTPAVPSIPKPTTPTPSIPKTPSSGGTGGGGGAGVGDLVPLAIPSGKAIPSNFDVGAVRAGEAKSDIIINVNAPSAIDEEGFTRAVVLALNNSTNRGTTGAGDLRTNAQIL
jgi:hypothetical protein